MNHETAAFHPIADNLTRCEACKSCGAILELDGCGHCFHPRCIYSWPVTHCEACDEPVVAVFVFRKNTNLQNSSARKGKWSIDEHKYANMMMKQFQLGALPLVDGLHLRVLMANMLQCDPLRVTKKYSGQAIGKQRFVYQHQKSYCYNLHLKLQKQLSNLRNHYYWHIQYRCKFGPNLNIEKLKAAEADYWIREFCKFANKIGQRVEFLTVSDTVPTASLSNRTTRENIIPPSSHPPTKFKNAKDDAISKPVVLPPVSSLIARVPDIKVEDDTAHWQRSVKSEEDTTTPSIKDGLSLILGLSSSMNQSPSPLSTDEWNDPSAFMDIALTDLSPGELSVSSTVDVPRRTYAQESLKKGSWMNDWMKEVELEWSKGAISWSFSLSGESLADFV